MPSRILSLPFIIVALVLVYLTLEVDENYAPYLIIPVIISTLIWILSPQINWWWYQKYPPKLDAGILQIFQRNLEYYKSLSPEQKTIFRTRTVLYIEASDFMASGGDEVPEDLKGMIASAAIILTFGYKDFLFKNFEKIVVNPKPFPSPQYPQFFHASEIFSDEGDGVLLFSAKQVATAFFHPKEYLNLPLYEFSKAFMLTYPNEPYPSLLEDSWNKLEQISGFSKGAISRWINLPEEELSLPAIAIHHFFVFPNTFKTVLPAIYNTFEIIFKQNPSNHSNPLIK